MSKPPSMSHPFSALVIGVALLTVGAWLIPVPLAPNPVHSRAVLGGIAMGLGFAFAYCAAGCFAQSRGDAGAGCSAGKQEAESNGSA